MNHALTGLPWPTPSGVPCSARHVGIGNQANVAMAHALEQLSILSIVFIDIRFITADAISCSNARAADKAAARETAADTWPAAMLRDLSKPISSRYWTAIT